MSKSGEVITMGTLSFIRLLRGRELRNEEEKV